MSAISYKCPNCDGELIFDPGTQQYKCEYCNSMFTQSELDQMQRAESEEQSAEQENGTDTVEEENGQQTDHAEGVIYTCPSCGAEIVTDETTAATFCYYCHNPVVLGGRLEGKYMPDKIIPFAIDKKTAVEKFLDYVSHKKFIPKAFFNKKQIEMISGVYFPYWVYDTQMQGDMNAKATKVRVWVVGSEEYTETKFYEVERAGQIELKDMTENALKKANNVLSEGVLPFKMEDAKSFNFGYLSGFLAEKRDIEQAQIAEEMQKEAEGYAQKILRESVKGYNTVTGEHTSFKERKDVFSYVLLPVWTLTYKGKNGKTYYYSMNGQTGKVCGKLPIDFGKVILTSIITAGIVFLAAMAGGYFIW